MPLRACCAPIRRRPSRGPRPARATGNRSRSRPIRSARCSPASPGGGRIALSIRDGFLFLAAVLAVWRHGSCAILLDAADPRAPRADLAREFGAGSLLHLDRDLRLQPVGETAPANDLAAIKLTSGSTGRPRGVGVGFAELVADAEALELSMGIGAGDRVFGA